jgi:serine/threonine-protein kinase
MLDRNGTIHVADFGIASAAGTDSLTMTGTVLGTAGYLSPEQAQGERAIPASDRYALAVVAFELLSGRRPFESESITAEAAAHVNAPVPSIAEICEGLPEELDAVFRQALAKDPAERFETASEFVAALRAALAEAAGATRSFRPTPTAAPPLSVLSPVTRRRAPRSRWPALAALLALAAVGGAIAAIVLTNGNGKSKAAPPAQPRTVTVTTQGSTVQTTVTAETTAPPPPPPAPASSSLSGSALNDAGYSKMQAGDYAGALPLLQQSVAKLSGVGFPNEAYANYNLGYTLLQLGRCSEAVPYLERAQQLEPQRHEPKDALKRAKHC